VRWKAELAQLEAVPGGVSIKRDTAVEGSTLKGNKAQESIGLVVAATQRLATDSDMEQSLEVGAWVERKKASVATRVLDDGSHAGS